MGHYLDDIADDDDIKVVFVRGEGGVFTTGVDLNRAYGWYNTPGDDRRPSQRRRLAVDRKGQRMFHEFIGFPQSHDRASGVIRARARPGISAGRGSGGGVSSGQDRHAGRALPRSGTGQRGAVHAPTGAR